MHFATPIRSIIVLGGGSAGFIAAVTLKKKLPHLEITVLRSRGCELCIPSRKNTKSPEPYDETLYRARHCIENLFQRLKVYRRIATCYEKTSRMFLALTLCSVAATYEQFNLWGPK